MFFCVIPFFPTLLAFRITPCNFCLYLVTDKQVNIKRKINQNRYTNHKYEGGQKVDNY